MNNKIINQVRKISRGSLKNDKTGHDFKHTKRVLKSALKISKNYLEADKEVLILACLLHDIAFRGGLVKDHNLVGAKQAGKILLDLHFSEEKTKKIVIAIEDHSRSFSIPLRKDKELQIESKILFDADTIDALGKMGLQRMIFFSNSQKFPIIITKSDKVNQSLHGNLKLLLTWPDIMLTEEGKNIGKKSLKPIKNKIREIEKNYLK